VGTISADFADETVVVTGGSSGIGRAVALGFGDAGSTVINADVREPPKDVGAETPTREFIGERGGTAAFVETDVSDPSRIETVIETAREFGGVDVMVNNAGVLRSLGFLDVTAEDLDFVHGVNLRGAFFGAQLAAKDMVDRGAEARS
jgi:NAD(P)-dependent dehydrogenase (short-subunit alcohol dehydrogenase family)